MRMHSQSQGRKRVTIVGAGFSGTLTATRLLQFADSPLEICLLEREEGYRYGGIAYGTASTTWDHMLNIQAGRITLYRERAEDFLEWANNEADRSDWPSRWQYHVFGLTCVVPRRLYSQYLKERLQRAIEQAHPDVSLVELAGEVLDVDKLGDAYEVVYAAHDANGAARTLHSDFVVLATGHLAPLSKPFYHRVRGCDRFIADPYAPQARKAFEAIGPEDTVFIAGTALSSFDAIVSLINAGHRGRVILSSRGGHLHSTYPSDHQHDIWTVRRPPFLDAEDLTPQAVVDGIRAEYEHLREALGAEVDPAVLPERVMKAWEPYVIELIERLEPRDVQQLLNTYKSLIVTRRTSTVPEIGNVVRNRMRGFNGAPQTISVAPGGIQDMRPIDGGHKIRILFRDQSDLVVDHVINCLGNQADYHHADHPLWHSLLSEHGFGQPHRATGRGVEVTRTGQLVPPDDRAPEQIYCVGPMRQGDETARRGRLGAFVFSIGTVRNQCFETATEILHQLRNGSDKDYAAIPDGIQHCLRTSSSWLVDHLDLGLPEPETARLREQLAAHAESSALTHVRGYYLAQDPGERASRRRALAEDMEQFQSRMTADFGLESDTAVRATNLLTILAEQHAVHAMCDITRLAEWRSAEYAQLAKPSEQYTPEAEPRGIPDGEAPRNTGSSTKTMHTASARRPAPTAAKVISAAGRHR